MTIQLRKDESFGRRFEGKWISVPTLVNGGRGEYTLTIKDYGFAPVFEVEKETEVEKDALTFEETDMGFVLNAENYGRLVRMFGLPPSGWPGRKITLYVDWSVHYRGHDGGVRIKLDRTAEVSSPAPRSVVSAPQRDAFGKDGAEAERRTPTEEAIDDEIPF
ncbi:MAG TPA: hypothetical protein VGX71_23835 [Pseudaminobacter sp.]|nr:hypothetical protein [Pseudaminobacter sp.]